MGTIARRIKRFAWPILPKPWQSPVMEVEFGLWAGVSALCSEGGRQLGEENTRPFRLSLHLPADTARCNYDGNRNGKQINLSALRVAMKNFDEAIAISRALKVRYAQKTGRAGAQLGIFDLYVLSRISISLISFVQRRVDGPSRQRHVSDILTSQYQFISGVFMIVRDMIEKADPRVIANAPMTGQDLYAYADECEIFKSPNDMVCAGSPRKIMEFLDHLVGDDDSGEGAASILPETVSDVDRWWAYAIAAIELETTLTEEAFRRKAHEDPQGEQRHVSIAAIYADIAQRCVRELGAHPFPEGEAFEHGVLMRQNAILEYLGRSPLTAIPERVLRGRLTC